MAPRDRAEAPGANDADGASAPDREEPGPELVELAQAYGVAVEYWAQDGSHKRVSAATLRAVLGALGVRTATPKDLWDGLMNRRLAQWRRMLPPVFVARSGRGDQCWVHVPHGQPVRMWVDLEQGGEAWFLHQVDRWVEPRHVDGHLVGEATFAIPPDLPLGWHTLWARSEGDDGVVRESSCPLVVTPDRLASAALAPGRQWGMMTQVYAMRSRQSWGAGDLADLAMLATWSARTGGADFVLVNPLHAASPMPPMEPSPYLPVTRRFANPIYLRPESITEYDDLPQDDKDHIEALAAPVRSLDLTADLIDRDLIWAAKSAALEIIFAAPRAPERQARFAAFVAREGTGLEDFATWCALVEEHGSDEAAWPAGLTDPGSVRVAEERVRLSSRVRWHEWLQWQLDEELLATQEAAVAAGMRSGIVHDLAVGVHPLGSDTWALRDVLARGVSVGAPPDMYNQLGQNWSQPPWRPDGLAEAAFLPYRDMLRTILRHAGGIRVDHVLGLFRLWMIPEGMKPYQGTFVRFDHEALIGILVLEAQRAGAFVVGEDLGTVEDWIQDYLLQRGVMGTSILWFERHPNGDIRRPHEWRQHVLASVTVHDLPPTAGYLAGEHVRIRSELGLLAHGEDAERASLEEELGLWRSRLREYGMLGADDETEHGLLVALHRYLGVSPAVMLGLSLPDVTGDRRAQNQPGTDQEYPNWRVPLCDHEGQAVLIDDLPGIPLVQELVAAIRGR